LWKQNKTKKKSVEKDQRREKIAVAKTTVASSNEVMEENEETLQQTERERNTKLKWTKKLRETPKKKNQKILTGNNVSKDVYLYLIACLRPQLQLPLKLYLRKRTKAWRKIKG
jgi:hypothetical protein